MSADDATEAAADPPTAPAPLAPRHGGLLRGDPNRRSQPQPKVGGWHWTEWGCEFVGTAFQLFVGFCVVGLMEAPGAPGRLAVASAGLRLLIIGAVFGALAALVAVSPVGRRSGAHLNPAVTLGFFVRGHTHVDDLAGYAVAQTAGALLAALGFAAALGRWAAGVSDARTAPVGTTGAGVAADVEAALTFGLLLTIFLMLSSRRTVRWTPAVVIPVLAVLIWAGARLTGASMNPARTLGPDIVTWQFSAVWVYLVGPPAGATAAALLVFALGRERQTLTAKLFHDPRYPTTHRTALPARPSASHRSQPS